MQWSGRFLRGLAITQESSQLALDCFFYIIGVGGRGFEPSERGSFAGLPFLVYFILPLQNLLSTKKKKAAHDAGAASSSLKIENLTPDFKQKAKQVTLIVDKFLSAIRES